MTSSNFYQENKYKISDDKKSLLRFAKTQEAVKYMLLNQPVPEKDIFLVLLEQIKKLVKYDQAVIMLLEGNSLIIKTKENIKISRKDYSKVISEKDKNLSKIIKNRVSILETKNISFPAELGIDFGIIPVSVLAVPLVIRKMVYGFVVLTNSKNCFNNDDVKILEAIVTAGSYIIKDAELSNVFKMQLKVLKDNIKERTRTLELIRQQNKKILEADKIKNEFLANMSHELRTPLNAIIGFSEVLSLTIFGDLNKKQAEYINDIHSSGTHLLGMINDLLDLAKIESGKMEVNMEFFDVKDAMEEAVNLIKFLAEKKTINLKINFNSKNIKINADKRKFHQILYNLLSNAIKFTPEGGNVTLGSSCKKNDIEIFVKDDGTGIASEYHKKIFEKFHQVGNFAEKTGSTGLGLTITRELIEMHGGKIRVESKEGKGANFIFTLPVNID